MPVPQSQPRRSSGVRGPLRSASKLLPEHARAHNRALVLRTLFHGGPRSRADLSRETGLTRVSISDLVADLLADGYVVELGVRDPSGPGKPAMLLDLDRTGHGIIGIDLSGSERLQGAILTFDGQILTRHAVAVPETGDEILSAVIALVRVLVAEAETPLLGVGIGTPGIVDARGIVRTAPNFGWREVDLDVAVGEATGLPVVVANDANAAILAEYTFGGADDDVMLVRIGRGVGSSLLAGGQPMRGSRYAAGEIGHVTIGSDDGPPCACGRRGCLEARLSVPALEQRVAAGAASDVVLAGAGADLAAALAPVVGALDLSEVVLSGPPRLLGGAFRRAMAETLRTRAFAELHGGIQVRMTEQGEDIVLRGAAVMVLAGQLGVS